MSIKAKVVFLSILLLFGKPLPETVLAATPFNDHVVFSPTKIKNNFPKSIQFTTHVVTEEVIQSAMFYYHVLNDTSTTQVPLEVEPSMETDLTYTWDTSKTGAIPGTPVYFSWKVVLSSGEIVRSEEESTDYDDIRFDWQVREKGKLSVWWHDRPDSLGDQVSNIAIQAMESQAELFGVSLDFPIKLIIYNNDAEFAEWHNTSTTLIGGQAFPSLGITTQIVEDTSWQHDWLLNVIPHEISHLYFFQVTYHPLSTVPSWLNEGLAQFNEFDDNDLALASARDAIQKGDYLPLWSLSGSFDDSNEGKFHQSYDESLSAVTYLIETYGKENLSLLLASYKNGNNTDRAFFLVFGKTFEDFEQDWLTWLEAPQGTYISPPDLTVPSMSDYLTQVVEKTPVTETSQPIILTPPSVSTSVPQATSTQMPKTVKSMNLFLIMMIILCVIGVLAILLVTGIIIRSKRHSNGR